MTTRRVTKKDPPSDADVGKFANCESIFRDGICSRSWEITKVSGSRVYLCQTRTVRSVTTIEEKYVKCSTLVFVSDTEAEADRMYALSEEQMAELSSTAKTVRARFAEIINNQLT